MAKIITSWRQCGYSKPYLLSKDKRICLHPKGCPWCYIDPRDMKDGFSFRCPLQDVIE